ncbi:MAG: hypothetical protein RRY64_10050, partial [Oscillospiraceae bacterium]
RQGKKTLLRQPSSVTPLRGRATFPHGEGFKLCAAPKPSSRRGDREGRGQDGLPHQCAALVRNDTTSQICHCEEPAGDVAIRPLVLPLRQLQLALP